MLEDRYGKIVLAVGNWSSGQQIRWELGEHMASQGLLVMRAFSQAEAATTMFEVSPSVVLIDLGLEDGSPLAVADFASYRHPGARVVFVSDGGIFADGSIFAHVNNAHAHVPAGMPVPDLSELILFHAQGAALAPQRGMRPI